MSALIKQLMTGGYHRLLHKKDLKKVGKLPKVVILGTGWGAISFLQKLNQDDLDVTIVSPRSFFFYTPLLAGTAVGTVRSTSIVEPIRWYFNRAGHSNASYVQASCSRIDSQKQIIYGVDAHGDNIDIDYDHLVVAVGAEPATFGIPGVRENALFMKEVDDGIEVQKRILERLEAASAILSHRVREEEHAQSVVKAKDSSDSVSVSSAEGSSVLESAEQSERERRHTEDEEEIARLLHWVVVGAGPTGVELCAEMSDFVSKDVSRYFPLLTGRVKVTLVEASDKVLGAFDERMSKYALSTLEERGVNIQCGSSVTRITPEHMEMKVKVKGDADSASTVQVPFGLLVWAGGLAPRPLTRSILAGIGSAQTSRFGLEVDSKLSVIGAPSNTLWALGDCAVSGCAPTAQCASQQGDYLGGLFRDTNMQADAINAYPDFKYVNKGSLAYLGGGKGVAEIRGLWDNHPVGEGGRVSGQVLQGQPAFVIWKSLYFSKLLSSRNQFQVAFDWVQTSMFGRDISTTHSINNTGKTAS